MKKSKPKETKQKGKEKSKPSLGKGWAVKFKRTYFGYVGRFHKLVK